MLDIAFDEPPALQDDEFDFLRAVIAKATGIRLNDSKRLLIVARLLPRLRALRLGSIPEYLARLRSDDAELSHLVDCVTTQETSFFREPAHFSLLDRRFLPLWREKGQGPRGSRNIRAWCAACATGEEPYSLAMTLLAALPSSDGWNHEVVASDVSGRALRRAKRGLFAIEQAADIPEHHRRAFMLRGVGPEKGRMRVGLDLRRIVRFEPCNLAAPPYPFGGSFDLIFIRNVLIYFGADAKRIALDEVLGRLAPNGLVFVGHAETLNGVPGACAVAPNVYCLRTGSLRSTPP